MTAVLLPCLLLFQDGTDGKQARRTKTSSPLGELFDHGIDSWATLFMPIGMYSVFGRGEHSISPDRVFYVLMSVMLTFLVSHWEKYNTGILFLPWGYDVSQVVGCFVDEMHKISIVVCQCIGQTTIEILCISSTVS